MLIPLHNNDPAGEQLSCRTDRKTVSDLLLPDLSSRTELALSHLSQWPVSSNQSINFILPTLAWYSKFNTERLITWITSDYVDNNTLKSHGIQIQRLRIIIDAGNIASSMRLFMKALENKRSSLVIGGIRNPTHESLLCLNNAAIQGNSYALALNYSDHLPLR